MRQLEAVLSVALGGAIGTVLRYLVGNWFVERFGTVFPWGTFAINVSGAFVIGVVLEVAATRAHFNPYLRVFIATGILGGYTTFSTYAFETYALGEKILSQAIAYSLGSVIAGIIAVSLGIALGRLL
jgi:CrcB protein